VSAETGMDKTFGEILWRETSEILWVCIQKALIEAKAKDLKICLEERAEDLKICLEEKAKDLVREAEDLDNILDGGLFGLSILSFPVSSFPAAREVWDSRKYMTWSHTANSGMLVLQLPRTRQSNDKDHWDIRFQSTALNCEY